MAYQIVPCKYCNSTEVVRYGTQSGHSRFRCKDCKRIFKTEYVYRAYEPGVKEQLVEMAMNGSGILDTARVLGIGKGTVISTLKKKSAEVVAVNPYIGVREIAVEVRHLFDSPRDVQADEQWSYVGDKDNQRWLWYAIDAATGCILSFVFGRRQDKVCEQLISNLKVFNIRTYYTDDWGSYSKLIPKDKHVIGKQNTQKIENKNLLLRTRIKRLARKTICFSKSEELHDAVIGLFINRYCFESA
jgi:IS1 family transposase/transposase-like protein